MSVTVTPEAPTRTLPPQQALRDVQVLHPWRKSSFFPILVQFMSSAVAFDMLDRARDAL